MIRPISYLKISVLCLMLLNGVYAQKSNQWTIMHYAVGSNSSEIDLLEDVKEMIAGKISDDYELILLIDRTEGHSEDSIALGENFTDTRMYRIANGTYEELNGGLLLPEITKDSNVDLNMADANVLKRFIQFSKAQFPAKHYMLIMRSHGNGLGMCPDSESGIMDRLYPGEMSDILTKEESVDILGLDVCSMAGLENMYEWRPGTSKFSADYIISSAPLSAAWAYDQMLGRLTHEKGVELDQKYFTNGDEEYLNPNTMTPLEFATMTMEEIYDSQRWASWGLFDNSKIQKTKSYIDKLSMNLVKESKQEVYETIEKSLGYHHNTHNSEEVSLLTFPYIDAYDFFERIATNDELGKDTRSVAKKVCESLDELVLLSYYGRGYFPQAEFTDGRNGVYLVLPVGQRIFSGSNANFWSHTGWFHPKDRQSIGNAYGMYDWCNNGAIEGNQVIENFFEYLDFLFEKEGEDVNGYQW